MIEFLATQFANSGKTILRMENCGIKVVHSKATLIDKI